MVINYLDFNKIYHFYYLRVITNVRYIGKVDIFDGEENKEYRVFQDILDKKCRIYLTDDEVYIIKEIN